jgi:uncharacterized protein YbaP (TraB family)
MHDASLSICAPSQGKSRMPLACDAWAISNKANYAAIRERRFMRRWLGRLVVITSMCTLVQFMAAGVSPASAQTGIYDKGLLWRIEKAGAAPSHLFGTVHLADPRVTKLPGAVREQFDAARSFAMEVSLHQSNVAALAARMVYLDGRDLPAVAGSALFSKLVPLTAGLGVPPEMARLFKPWAMVLLLQMPQQDAASVLDFMLHQMASEQGKTLHYLETVDEQVAAFESMSEADQLALLKHAVETHQELKAQTERLVQAYLQRDLRLMWTIGEEEVIERPALKPLKQVFDQRLLYDRNLRMLQRMQPQLKTGAAFIAVGALHLYGDRGLLSLLARDGYRLSRVY